MNTTRETKHGFYYLHTNGDLIYKPYSVITDPSYFSSPFVVRVWRIDISDRADAWRIVLEALALGVSIERAKDLSKKWNLTYKDSIEMLRQVTPTRDMADGMTVFIKQILEMELDDYWNKVQKILGSIPLTTH